MTPSRYYSKILRNTNLLDINIMLLFKRFALRNFRMSLSPESFKVIDYLFPRAKGSITCISTNFNYYFDTNLVVGPGALKNTCTCLSYCKEKDDESLKAAKTEEAYADMGGEPIAAGMKNVNAWW